MSMSLDSTGLVFLIIGSTPFMHLFLRPIGPLHEKRQQPLSNTAQSQQSMHEDSTIEFHSK